jgi:hypothetical protein
MPITVDQKWITVPHDDKAIKTLLDELFVGPRKALYAWSRITGQTAQVRLAYPGQHLASVVTGVSGRGTAARGDDLADGSEVKSCSRADQLGECKLCHAGVPSSYDKCPDCDSPKIKRKTDSHWIFAITTQAELELHLEQVPRIVLILFDRSAEELKGVRVRVWEVWPKLGRHMHFGTFLTDYFTNNYLAKVEMKLKPSPCNLHPLTYDFFLMNPVKVFEALLTENPGGDYRIEIVAHAGPTDDRGKLPSEIMPSKICNPEELNTIFQNAKPEELAQCIKAGITVEAVVELAKKERWTEVRKAMPGIDEDLRRSLVIRQKKIKSTPSKYRRGSRGALPPL